MTLRDPHFIGTVDPLDLTGARPTDVADARLEPGELAAEATRDAVPGPTRPGTGGSRPEETTRVSAPSTTAGPTAIPDLVTPRAFVQILSPPQVANRIARASHSLASDHPRLCHQKTIVGALIARDITDPDDPVVLAAMAALLARWRQDPMDDERCSRRLGWHLPLPLSDRLKTLLTNLRESHYPLRASATALLTAMIWYEVDTDGVDSQHALVNLVTPYYDAWEKPNYQLIAP
jgi:hypothetical protein